MKNIISITCDELTKTALSYYGNTTIKTSNIDFLLQNGTNFNDAYTASPICLPSRCTWVTGMSPYSSGSLSNTLGASLSQEHSNIFKELKKAGYNTSLHGKCHFAPVHYTSTKPDITQDYEPYIAYYKSLGIDHLDLQDGDHVSLWFYDNYAKELDKKGYLKEFRRYAHQMPENQAVFDFPGPKELHPDAWSASKAIERIRNAKANELNYIHLSFSGPHYPIDTPKEYSDKVNMDKDKGRIYSKTEWDDASKYHVNGYYGPGTTEGSGQAKDKAQKNYGEEYWKKWRRGYFGNILLIDDYIGKVKAEADKKWGNNYVIIFTSDHGDLMGNHSLWGKNGALFEEVLQIPLCIYDKMQPSRSVHCRVSSIDIAPTILSYANMSLPATFEGIPLFEEEKRGGMEYIISSCQNRFALIYKQYKLEWNFYEKTKTLYKEFYDLEKDPYEFTNCYCDEKYASIVKIMEDYVLKMEEEHKMLSSLFEITDPPFYANYGKGSGLKNNS